MPPDSPDIRLGRAANEKDLKALDLGAYRFLHFATHGVLAGDVPYLNQPALVLSQTADLGGEDGFLTMSEVLQAVRCARTWSCCPRVRRRSDGR